MKDILFYFLIFAGLALSIAVGVATGVQVGLENFFKKISIAGQIQCMNDRKSKDKEQ